MPASDPIAIPDGVPEDAVDALYGLPLDEFTPRRDELVKELRSAGKRDEAAWVKALRKPSAAAWLVNQLARSQTKDAKRMLEEADALRTAQERALAGNAGRDELSGAAAAHADAMRALMEKAPGLLDRQGSSPSEATLERAAETLHAIPLNDEARAGFAAGRLTREHRAAGLGFAASGGPAYAKPAKPAKPPKAPKAPTKESRQAAEQKEQKAQAQAALKEARSRRRTRQREASEAEREVKQLEREAERVQRRLEKAEAALDRARERQAEAESQVEEAEARLR
jgi:hypothetical protein